MRTTIQLLLCLLPFISACQSGMIPIGADDQTSAGNVKPPFPAGITEDTAAALPQSETLFAKAKQEVDTWSLIRDKLQLHGYLSQQSVKERIKWFARDQDYIDRFVERARPYLFHIVSRLQERGMPLDLALLPIVESAYQPFAYSSKHASGIWQFMPATGKHYGLKQNWWYDGRRDIIASTEAALDYLQALYKRFDGNWLHALAAYNVGEGRVENAIRKNRKARKDTNFWSLHLPPETRAYVPSLLAVAEILKNHQKYNIHFNPVPRQAYFEAIDVGSQIDLATAAELSGLGIDEVYRLNPGFNRWATDPDGPHRLLMPTDKAEDFKQKLASLPESERIGWTRYRIRAGDSLSLIAAKYHISISALKKTNRLKNNLIRPGHSLLIPTAKRPGRYYALSAEGRKFRVLKEIEDGRAYIYTVKSGDNLWEIAKRYDVSVRQLKRWNGLNGSLLRPKQKLTIRIRDDQPKKTEKKIKLASAAAKKEGAFYTVRQGDSLWLIARKFKVHISNLLKWNGLERDKYLQPGQHLIIKRIPTGA